MKDIIKIETPSVFQNVTHMVTFWIKPSKKRIYFQVALPIDSRPILYILTENYANRGYNPVQSVGHGCFSRTNSIILDAMEKIDADRNHDIGVISVIPC
jgi:hypothetical protein